jgi:hypothetical protein
MTKHDHVRQATAASVNQRIREEASERIERASGSTSYARARLRELDAEWNVERALETISSLVSLTGLGLAATGRTRWLRLPIAVQAFLLQHALQGWCPPLAVLRRLGFRTQQEIERERYTLRAMLREQVGLADNDRPSELPARATADEPS